MITRDTPITSRRLYSVLRKAGYHGRNRSSRWPVVRRDSDTYTIWYTVTWESYEGPRSIPVDQRLEALKRMQVVLSQAGIESRLNADDLRLIVLE
jgi:hypothetical protein